MGYHAYHAGPSKEYVRNDVLLFFNTCSTVLTLPNLYFDLEQKLIIQGKTVECVERDSNIFSQQLALAPPAIKLHCNDVYDMNLSKYDGIFLDLCGPMSATRSYCFNTITPGTRIVITLLMARESKYLQRWIDITNREESYWNYFKTLNITIEKSMLYNDSSPMCVFFGTKH